MHLVRRRIVQFVLVVVNHPVLTLVIAGVVVAACTLLAATRLTLSSNQNELFSPDVPFFRDWLMFVREFPENEALYILIEPSDPKRDIPVARWTGAADTVAAAVGRLPAVRSVDAHVPLGALGDQGLLFDDAASVRNTVRQAQAFTPLVRLWAERPGPFGGILGRTPLSRFLSDLGLAPRDPGTADFLAAIAESWQVTLARTSQESDPLAPGRGLPRLELLAGGDPSRLGYYYVADDTDPSRHLLLVRVYPKVEYKGLTAVSDAVDSIRAAALAIGAAYPEFQIGVTGRPALEADEMRTTDSDSHKSEVLALIAVFIGLVVAMRSFWLAAAAEIALVAGIGWTFGWATLSVGHLNLLSIVFLIALIGIGMDYLVQILTRYRHEIRLRRRADAVWARVFTHIGPPINTACAGAAGAFLVSIFTAFKGASELGIIAGGGLLLCLLAGYTVLPALLTLLPLRVNTDGRDPGWSADRGRVPAHVPLALPGLWIVLLAAGVPFMLRTHFDPGLLDLQAQNLRSVQLVRKLQTWSAVVLSRDLDVLRRARAAVEGSPLVAGTDSILTAYDNADWIASNAPPAPRIAWSEPLPVQPADIPALERKASSLARKMESAGQERAEPAKASFRHAAAALRGFASELAGAPRETVAQRLSDWQVAFVAQLCAELARLRPPPLDTARLPRELRAHFVSDSGLFALYIYPKQDLWIQRNLTAFVRDLEARLPNLPPGSTLTGIAEDIAHSTERIQQSFYQSAAAALALIFVLVLIDLRNISLTVAAVSVLGLGLPMLVAIMGWLNVSWNFANFFGLPILIGAGHEYGVFMVHRYVEARNHERRPWIGWDASDKALLLCAFVTSTSFGFFWVLAHHQGLRSLGLVMAVGTACIYIAAVAVLRPVLKWRLARRGQRSPGRHRRIPRAVGELRR